jgi:UDP-N-acetylmuramoylalanine--D-glutamate ligase
MNLQHKKIGVWGYGIVGKSALAFLPTITKTISLYDQKELAPELKAALQAQSITCYLPSQLQAFLEEQECIISSPGIDLRPYAAYQHKFISELDLFAITWHKPIIGITGTIGKTSITHLLSQILSAAGVAVATGGNIGTGMLDLLPLQQITDYALLELSSFQLELCKQAAPDIAIITNIYPNHIDRHGSLEAYQAAKLRMISLQTDTQQALLPLSLSQMVSLIAHPAVPAIASGDGWERSRRVKRNRAFAFFSENKPSPAELATIKAIDTVYYQDQDKLYKYTHNQWMILDPVKLPPLSYPGNLLIIQAVLDMLSIHPQSINRSLANLHVPEHRLTCVAEHNGIRFYNDSKATIPEAMLAAVTKLKDKPTILFLGGISKGVDRTMSIAKLKHLGVKHVLCFGKEAPELFAACAANKINATSYTTLEEAFMSCMQSIAQAGDQLLFSPAGASFDLFSNYETRGATFTRLVKDYLSTIDALKKII